MSLRHILSTVAGLVTLTFVALAFTASPASASDCYTKAVKTDHGLKYVTVCPGTKGHGGTPGTKGGGGPSKPTCVMVSPATFCQGTAPCYIKPNVVPFAPPKGPPPTPGAKWHVVMCLHGGYIQQAGRSWVGQAVWDGTQPQPPSLQDQARTAVGELRAPAATLTFNPPGYTVVTVPTWFWAQGLTTGELRGSSAFGLVAIATPDRIDLTPGDGSALLHCPWSTGKSDVCSHAYPHSSSYGATASSGGKPAFAAHATAYWTIRFEQNGAEIQIPGAQTEFSGPAMDAPVVVNEIGTTVTGSS